MALTEDLLPGNNTPGPYNFTFKWLESSDIYVSVDGVDQTETTHYILQGLNFTTKEGGQVLFTTSIPSTSSIRIYRNTDDTATKSTFYPGSAIRSQDLNDNFTQTLYRMQETSNYAVQDFGDVTLLANYSFTLSPSAPTPTATNHLATKGYVDSVAFGQGLLTLGDKGDIVVNSAVSWSIKPSAIDTSLIADQGITKEKLATEVHSKMYFLSSF